MISHNLDIGERTSPHYAAMRKFEEKLAKHPDGFDFTVPVYRKAAFIRSMRNRGMFLKEIAESTMTVRRRTIGLFERIKSRNFRKRATLELEGVGIYDIVAADFATPLTVYFLMMYGTATRNCVCYSVAPTRELFDKNEEDR